MECLKTQRFRGECHVLTEAVVDGVTTELDTESGSYPRRLEGQRRHFAPPHCISCSSAKAR